MTLILTRFTCPIFHLFTFLVVKDWSLTYVSIRKGRKSIMVGKKKGQENTFDILFHFT